MTSIDWTPIINAALKVVAMVAIALTTAYVIPWITKKKEEIQRSINQIDNDNLRNLIKSLVAGAEQIAINEGYDGNWKKRYVKELIMAAFGLEYIDEELDTFIESEVILLHKALYGEVE